MDVLDFASNTGLQALLAGTAIARGDLLAQGQEGEFWPVDVLNFAKVANAGSATLADQTILSTLVDSAQGMPEAFDATTGRTLLVVPNSAPQGCAVEIWGPNAVLLRTVVLSSAASTMAGPIIKQLSNGTSFAVTCLLAGILQYAVIDINGVIVKAMTAGETPQSEFYTMTALKNAGNSGFMICYLKDTLTTQRVATFSNAGVAVTVPTTIQTWVGTIGGGEGVRTRLIELSNGEVGAAFSSQFTTTVGTYYATLTAAGAVDHAFTQLDSYKTTTPPKLGVCAAGFWAIANQSAASTGLTFRSLSNAGAVQGTPLVIVASSSAENMFAVDADATQFYLLYQSTSTKWQTLALSTAGATVTTYVPLDAVNSIGVCSAFVERGRLIVACAESGGTTGWFFFVLNLSTGIYDTGNTLLVNQSTGAIRIVPAGDFSFMMYSTITTPSNQTHLQGVKYVNASVQGVAQNAAAAGSTAYAKTGGRGTGGVVSSTNARPGTNVMLDHSAANIPGNKGSMSTGGVSLEGLGIAA